jgi:hypothetical protein
MCSRCSSLPAKCNGRPNFVAQVRHLSLEFNYTLSHVQCFSTSEQDFIASVSENFAKVIVKFKFVAILSRYPPLHEFIAWEPERKGNRGIFPPLPALD